MQYINSTWGELRKPLDFFFSKEYALRKLELISIAYYAK